NLERPLCFRWLPHAAQDHVTPVRRRYAIVVIPTRGEPGLESTVSVRPVMLQVVRESQVVPDIPVQGADGDIQGIRHAVGLDCIFPVPDQVSRNFEIFDRAIELAYGDIAMAAV